MSTNKPFSEQLDEVENGIIGYKKSDVEKCGAIVSLDEYAGILNSIIEGLSRGQRRRNNDPRRDRALNLMDQISCLSDKTSRAQIMFSDKSLSFLSDYKFEEIKTLEEAQTYINENPSPKNWNTIKFNKFIPHFLNLEGDSNDKADILSQLFDSDRVRGHVWDNENYLLFAEMVDNMSDAKKRQVLLVAFNDLPGVKRDRRRGRPDDKNDPWNILFYERMNVPKRVGVSTIAQIPGTANNIRPTKK